MADLNTLVPNETPPAPAAGEDTVEVTHPDEQALAAAEDELAAEQPDDAGGDEPPAGDQAVLPVPPTAAVTPPVDPGPMVPAARLGQMAARVRAAEMEVAVEKGKRQLLEDLVKSGAISAEHGLAVREGRAAMPAKAPTPEEQLSSLRAEQRGLAKKQLEMDPEAYEAERQRLEDLVFDLRIKQMQPQAPAPAARGDDLSLSDATSRVATLFPILEKMTEDQLVQLVPVAIGDMKREGRPYNANDPKSVLALRTQVAVLADRIYDNGAGTARLLAQVRAGATPPTPAVPAGAGNGARPATPPPNGRMTPAQMAEKVALQRRQPPMLEAHAEPAAGTDGITEASLLEMTTEDIDKLPASVLERIEKGTHPWH